MRVTLDTNIVVHNANRSDQWHHRVAERLRGLVSTGAELCIAPQSVFEFWVVATRPVEVNGLGLSPVEARQKVDDILSAFVLLPDPPGLMERWLHLCERREVRGRQAHDARLAAWMLEHGVKELLTLNPADFTRFDEIRCIGLD